MKKDTLTYIPALTGIRALAIALVLIFHWLPSNHPINSIPNGPIGVTIFFTLSGFLITRILSQEFQSSVANTYLNFLVRRALRIFPIYFLVLFVVHGLYSLFSIKIQTDFYTSPLYFYGYAYNILLEKTGNWADYLSPYWSLAVEEQFYALWGIMVLYFQKDFIRKNLYIITVFVGMLSRYVFIYLVGGVGVLTLTCIDCFAWGGLIYHFGHERAMQKWLRQLSWLSILGLGIMFAFELPDSNIFKIIFFRTFVSIVAANIINQLVENEQGVLSKIFGQKLLVKIGNISYGLYVYHMVLPILFFEVINRLGIGNFPVWHWPLFEYFLVIMGSVASWYLIEKPINSLKAKFKSNTVKPQRAS